MKTALALLFALASMLWFAWPLTLLALVACESLLTGSALALGFASDLVNRPASSVYVGTIAGLSITLALMALRRLVRHRFIRNGPALPESFFIR